MLKGVNPAVCNFSNHHHHNHHVYGTIDTAVEYNDRFVDEAIYGSDEFRMYAHKIERCPRMQSHDWTECPYAHRGEKAQRRDPRKHNYAAIVCPAFRNGSCEKGDSCEFAHGVFEYWLHPTRYRTRPCNSGQFCQRKVCFFAHSPDQLRPGTKFKRYYAYRARTALMDALNSGDDGSSVHRKSTVNCGTVRDVGPATSSSMGPTMTKSVSTSSSTDIEDDSFEKFSEFLKSLRALKISDGGDHHHHVIRRDQRMMMMMSTPPSSGFDVSESDLPHVEWISELVQ